MKKLQIFIVLFLSTFALSLGFAQTNATYTPIGQRNYIGIEAGINYGWQAGAENFLLQTIYPNNSSNVLGDRQIMPYLFTSLGNGIGFRFGATIDLNLSEMWNFVGKVHYRSQSTSSTESPFLNLPFSTSQFWKLRLL